MSVVDVDSLIEQSEKSETLSNLKDKANTAKLKKEIIPKKRKLEFGKPPPTNPVIEKEKALQMIHQLRMNQEEQKEVKNSVKEGIFFLSSLPMPKDRRDNFKNDLHQSRFLNNYIDESVYTRYLSHVNQDAKAVACYGYYFIKNFKKT
jgi:hypothetical protein